jgi:hypothetical protein
VELRQWLFVGIFLRPSLDSVRHLLPESVLARVLFCLILSSRARFSACTGSRAASGVFPVFRFCFPCSVFESVSGFGSHGSSSIRSSGLVSSVLHGQESGLLPQTFSRDQVLARAVLARRVRKLVLLVSLIFDSVFQFLVVCELLQGEVDIVPESPD